MNKLTCNNEPANEISPPIEVVLIKEEIADTCVLQDDNALEEEETLDENDEFSAPKSSANMNDDMQYSSSSSEERNMENFLNRVKTETEFNIIHDEIQIKDERFFEATDSKSENKSNKKLLNGATNKPVMTSLGVKYCFVPGCLNTSATDPQKLYVTVPKNEEKRAAWFQAVAPDENVRKSCIYACEDHFDLPNDAENWMFYKTIGTDLRLKKDVIPKINSTAKHHMTDSETKRKRKNVEMYESCRRKFNFKV